MPSEDHPDGPGLSALELLALSPLQRLIVRLLLRAGELSYASLAGAVEDHRRAQAHGLGDEPFDAALLFLCDQQWLVPDEGQAGTTYHVHVRQKPANRRRGEIWRRLDLGGEGEG